jgi:hypothetical protein
MHRIWIHISGSQPDPDQWISDTLFWSKYNRTLKPIIHLRLISKVNMNGAFNPTSIYLTGVLRRKGKFTFARLEQKELG